MAMPQFTMRQLLEAGIHFGHHTRRWNPKMKPYLFGVRNGVHIIDLTKTVPLLEAALLHAKERFAVALGNSPIAVFEQDLDLRYTWIHNPKLGYRAEDFLGKTDADLMDASCVPALEAIKRRVIMTGANG